MNANEMIDRYVNEVGNNLPAKGREDIQQELKSLLQDSLEERAADGEPTVQMVAKILLEYGKPENMAQQYRTQQYLISPKLFPLYRQVGGIVLTVITALYLVFLALVLWNSADLTTSVWNWLTDYVQTAIFSIGMVTLIFAAIERYAGDEVEVESAEFDPFSLPPVNDPNRVSRFEVVAEIVVTIVTWGVGLALISQDGVFGGLIAESFRPNIAWLVASAGVEVAVKVLVLWQNRWQLGTRLFDLGSELFGLYVLYRVVSADAILTIDVLNAPIKLGLSVVMGIIAIVTLVKFGQLLWRHGWRQPWRLKVIAQ